jgi:sulfur-oxidizing protein SoxY
MTPTFKRRDLLGLAAGTVLVRPVLADEPTMSQAIAAFTQNTVVLRGRVKLTIAPLVDNGNVVPVTVSVDSPMTAEDHVTAIAIFNEKNPQRDVARFTLGPRSGTAVARTSKGEYWSDVVEVVVVLAACIEGDT